MSLTPNNENQPETIVETPKKRKPIAKIIIMIIIGLIVATGIGYGAWTGIEAGRQITAQSNYRSAVDDLNEIVNKYNELAGLESINGQSNDEETMKSAAAKDAATVENIVADIDSRTDQLSENKIFTSDDEAKRLIDELVVEKESFVAFYRLVIESYKLRAEGDFAGAAEKVISGDVNTDGNFADTLNNLSQYITTKANGL